MAWVVVGLGNPGEEYAHTRHNAGRMAVEHFAQSINLSGWKNDAKKKCTVARGNLGKELVVTLLPDTYMNKSGSAVAPFIKTVKGAEKLIVAHDDLDLPLGIIKVSFGRGSGGHKGIESIMRAVKTKNFTRVRIGVSRATASGKLKKPSGEKEVVQFILEKFTKAEEAKLTPIFKRASAALTAIIERGPQMAMNEFNRG